MNAVPPWTAATYVALFFTVIGLWMGRWVWSAMLGAAVVLGYMAGVLEGPALIWIVAFAALCIGFERAKTLASSRQRIAFTTLATAALLVLALLLGLHVLPGFHNFLALDDVVLSEGAEPYTLYLNFDKTIVGICLLGLCYRPLLKRGSEWHVALRRAAPIILINTVVVALFAMALGYLHWQPRWTPVFGIWAFSNLFLTCLSEEALFRGFMQRELMRYGPIVAITASAVLFGLAHFAGGVSYVLLATAAGFGYAIVYHRTKSIEMSMLAHFALNTTHFLLFTYPRTG